MAHVRVKSFFAGLCEVNDKTRVTVVLTLDAWNKPQLVSCLCTDNNVRYGFTLSDFLGCAFSESADVPTAKFATGKCTTSD